MKPPRSADLLSLVLWLGLAVMQFGWIIWPKLGLLLALASVAFLVSAVIARLASHLTASTPDDVRPGRLQ